MNTGTRTRNLRKIGNWAGIALLVAAASCVQILDGAYEYQAICTTGADCEDGNPCTTDECLRDNSCVHTPTPNGILPAQTVGDCRRDECLDGEVVSTNDDADIQDDAESCTTDTCASGSPVHAPVDDGTMCIMGESAGSCAKGVCTVECTASTTCNDLNPCTEDTCNVGTGTCAFAPLDGMPTPGFIEPEGDCKIHICSAGLDVQVNDDSDRPNDMNPCTDDVCTAGVPSNPMVSAGIMCAMDQPGVCDGQGTCVQCIAPADCVMLPPDDDCQKRTCDNHVCGQTFTTSGTPISMQTIGDCSQVVCDGNGGTLIENLDTDLPEDNNPCTSNVCAAGIPSNPTSAPDTPCGNGMVCDNFGMCQECLSPTICPGTDDFCKMRACVNNTCGFVYTPAGTDLPNGQTSMDCKVVECDGQGNIITSVDLNDKPVDGNQCTQDVCSALGNPSNPFEPLNTACDQDGGTVCNGAGACKSTNGANCSVASDCLSGLCVDGVCCNGACAGTCQACNVPGSVGTCSNVPVSNEDAPGCTGTNSCDGAGSCKKDDGQTCASSSECVSNFCIDGVCCASACTQPCHACDLMGSIGTCSNVPAGQDDAGTCSGTNQSCDGAGACKLDLGSACAVNSTCLSGFCVDGVCCNEACLGICEACSAIIRGQGLDGICGPIVAGSDPDDECMPGFSCDGAGMCN